MSWPPEDKAEGQTAANLGAQTQGHEKRRRRLATAADPVGVNPARRLPAAPRTFLQALPPLCRGPLSAAHLKRSLPQRNLCSRQTKESSRGARRSREREVPSPARASCLLVRAIARPPYELRCSSSTTCACGVPSQCSQESFRPSRRRRPTRVLGGFRSRARCRVAPQSRVRSFRAAMRHSRQSVPNAINAPGVRFERCRHATKLLVLRS